MVKSLLTIVSKRQSRFNPSQCGCGVLDHDLVPTVAGAGGGVSGFLQSCFKDSIQPSCAQSCPTLYNPMDGSPPGSSVHGILQQKYWRGLPFPPPGDLPDPGNEPESPALKADPLPLELSVNTF